jgi:hypothetical protein
MLGARNGYNTKTIAGGLIYKREDLNNITKRCLKVKAIKN